MSKFWYNFRLSYVQKKFYKKKTSQLLCKFLLIFLTQEKDEANLLD